MTIRGGRRPRDIRSQAHPVEPEEAQESRWLAGSVDDRVYGRNGGDRTTRRANGGRNGSLAPARSRSRHHLGLGGLVRFLAFALVLAAVVLAATLTVLRPVVSGTIAGWAYDNPGALRIPFVADVVRENLGSALNDPASNDASEVDFPVMNGDTPQSIAPRLVSQGLLKDERAFIFEATLKNLAQQLQEGDFRLAANMTPGQLVDGLVNNRIVVMALPVNFREGLRIEQITAKLQTLGSPVTLDAHEFYQLATNPPARLLADFPWLKKAGLPKGASLEGFLGAATYTLTAETTAEDLIRQMLDTWHQKVGDDRLNVPKSRGLTFFQVMTLASIVEREAKLDEERPLIAGVYQNRLDPKLWPTGLLQADPTVIYGVDTVKLGEYSDQWQQYSFWNVPEGHMKDQQLDGPLAGFQTYRSKGLPPGPICTPTAVSIDAALQPDTKDKYLFFVAIPNGNGQHAFAKTQQEHEQNLRKYGYL
jgi:UPF0755 protein